MATRKPQEESETEVLGQEGDVCAQCGTPLAIDQRYCLNCGTPRAQPRLDYENALADQRSGGGAAQAGGASANSVVQWSPLLAIVAIAILGAMLLLGVLIGQDDNDVTVTEVPATNAQTATTPTESFPTEETTTTPPSTDTSKGGDLGPVPTTGTTTVPTPSGAGGLGPPSD